jgi:hypothetical protein
MGNGSLIVERGAAVNFVPNRDEVTGGWITLHNVELHNLKSHIILEHCSSKSSVTCLNNERSC